MNRTAADVRIKVFSADSLELSKVLSVSIVLETGGLRQGRPILSGRRADQTKERKKDRRRKKKRKRRGEKEKE